MGENLSQLLEPIAARFRSLDIPHPITHWGHPLMMAIVIFVMGSFVAYAGWRGRLATNGEVALKNRIKHRNLAPWMYLFISLGYIGGILALVMHHEPILESPHFWTGSIVLILLGINATIALTGFGGSNKELLRFIHAYLGSVAMILLVIQAAFGLKLGLSI